MSAADKGSSTGKRRVVAGSALAAVVLLGGIAAWQYWPASQPAPSGSGEAPPPKTTASATVAAAKASDYVDICSFNVQFLGSSKTRDNKALANLLKDHDIVVIQEVVAPPYDGTFPDGTAMKPDPQARAFFDEMKAHGFEYWLSEEDTGTGAKIHSNGSDTEYWVTFYKPGKVKRAPDLPSGFLAGDRSDNPDYERVPYAFPFRTMNDHLDFVLISVHLAPDASPAARARRKHELAAIGSWVAAHDGKEKDFIILGDMNIEDKKELADATPPGFRSLNDECRPTNTNVKSPKPYDHVMFRPTYTTEMDTAFDLKVVDLRNEMKATWTSSEPYPGDPYEHDKFRALYSDHDPVVFRLKTQTRMTTNASQSKQEEGSMPSIQTLVAEAIKGSAQQEVARKIKQALGDFVVVCASGVAPAKGLADLKEAILVGLGNRRSVMQALADPQVKPPTPTWANLSSEEKEGIRDAMRESMKEAIAAIPVNCIDESPVAWMKDMADKIQVNRDAFMLAANVVEAEMGGPNWA